MRVPLTVALAILAVRGASAAEPVRAVKLFSATPVTESAPCANPLQCSPTRDRVVYDEMLLVLSCRARPTAVLSGTPDGRGPLIVDNFIEVNGSNVCVGGAADNGTEQCYNVPFFGAIGSRALDAAPPVAPIDVRAAMPVHGRGAVLFSLIDYGGLYFNSDVWLVTDCAIHQKASICHKPGTPAEKILTVGSSAISGHLRHGDTLDLSACRR